MKEKKVKLMNREATKKRIEAMMKEPESVKLLKALEKT